MFLWSFFRSRFCAISGSSWSSFLKELSDLLWRTWLILISILVFLFNYKRHYTVSFFMSFRLGTSSRHAPLLWMTEKIKENMKNRKYSNFVFCDSQFWTSFLSIIFKIVNLILTQNKKSSAAKKIDIELWKQIEWTKNQFKCELTCLLLFIIIDDFITKKVHSEKKDTLYYLVAAFSHKSLIFRFYRAETST